MQEGEKLYNELKQKGYKVCLDDRNYSIGEKIKDNELFGIRKTIIIGNSYLNNGDFEFEDRKTNLRQILSENEIYSISVQ